VIRFDQATDITRPIDEVFAYLADFTNIPSWNYYVQQVRRLTPGAVAVGTVYDQVRRTDRQRFQITAYDAPRTVAVTTLPGERPAFHRRLELQPATGGGTRVHDFWELDTGHPTVVQRLAARGIKAAVGENLALLKQLLEQGHTRLQDGRVVALDTNRRD
jgi:uncharacterized membrane protein